MNKELLIEEPELQLDTVVVDQGTATSNTGTFNILLDASYYCYEYRWKKVCANGSSSDWRTEIFGDCGSPTLPTIGLTTASCRTQGTCNDNATCGVKYMIDIANAPAGSYITLTKTAGTAQVTLMEDDPFAGAYLIYTEANGTQSVTFNLFLKSSTGTVIASKNGIFLSHSSMIGQPWNQLPVCLEFINHNACVTGNNITTFTIKGIAGTVLMVKLDLSGFFSWGNVVGSGIVTIYGRITQPAGLGAADIVSIRHSPDDTTIDLESPVAVQIVIPPSGLVPVTVLANIENAGSSGFLLSGAFKVVSINGSTANENIYLCTGFSTGG